jgi:hypothetical protein
MLRQPALTAKRTMTRAGDVNDALDREAAIRERLLIARWLGTLAPARH